MESVGPWILWVIFMVALGFGALVSGILAYTLEGQYKKQSTDMFLVIATLWVTLGYCSNFLEQKDTKDHYRKRQDIVDPFYVSEAELYGNAIRHTSNVDTLFLPYRILAHSEGVFTTEREMREVDAWLRKKAFEHPKDPNVVARLAILVHEEGGDASQILKAYQAEGGPPTALIDALNEIYAPAGSTDERAESETSKSDADAKDQSETNISMSDENVQSAPQSEEKAPAGPPAAVISKELPQGWFRQAALLQAYKLKSSPDADLIVRERDNQRASWQIKYCIYETVRAMCCLVFVAAIISLRSRKNLFTLQGRFANFGFRKAYGCMLSFQGAQFIAGFLCGYFFAAANGGDISNVAPGQFSTTIVFVGMLSQATSAIIAVYYLICRPANISLLTLWRGDRKITWARWALVTGLGFASASTVKTLAGLIPGVYQGSSNTLQTHVSNALAANDLSLVIWFGIAGILVSPLVEETLFRGLFYSWLRHRAGKVVAAIVTSAAFALLHFDPLGVIQYFGLGLVFAYFYERTRSIFLVASIHACWNAWVLLTMSALN